MEQVSLGIDVSKKHLDGAVWVDGQATSLGRFKNNETGFVTLIAATQPYLEAEDQLQIIVEPTGGYEFGLVGWAHQQGLSVSLPNPKRVRDWAKGSGVRAKTDKVDATTLAHFGAKQQPHPLKPLPPELLELETLLARQVDLKQMLRQESNRQQAFNQRTPLPSTIHSSLRLIIATLQQSLAEINQAIEQLIVAHPWLQQKRRYLLSVCGVGHKIVPHLLFLLARWDIQTDGLGSAKQLTAFVGLDPQPFQSGSSVWRPASISKMGNPRYRYLLYMGALGGKRGHNPLRDFYERLVGRGKAKKLALVAAARKILIWAWAVYRSDSLFDPNKASPNLA